MTPRPLPPLTDRQVWDALHAALQALNKAPGATEVGEHVLSQAQTMLIEFQKVMLARIDNAKPPRKKTGDLINLNLKVRPEVRPALDLYKWERCPGASTAQAAAQALATFLERDGYLDRVEGER